MPDITNPHDKFFHQVWCHKEIARDFLVNYLPECVAEHLDLDSLHLEKSSYVDETLRDQYSDLLYSVDLAEGGEGFVYILFEHKSYADPHVAVQLLRYMGAIWDQYLKGQDLKGQGTRGNRIRRLPMIVPLVFYHGAQNWQPRTLGELIEDVPDALAPYIPDFQFIFSDFSAVVSPEFRGQALLQAILRLLHTIPGGNLRHELNRIMLLVNGVIAGNPTATRIFRAMLKYIFAADDSVTVDEVVSAVRTQISAREGAEAMTIAEKLRKEGQTTILQRQLENRFGELSEQSKQRLEQADSEVLLQWSERILTAKTIEEVFGE